jgi:hypothetical protein
VEEKALVAMFGEEDNKERECGKWNVRLNAKNKHDDPTISISQRERKNGGRSDFFSKINFEILIIVTSNPQAYL